MIRLLRILFFLDAVIWLVFGVAILARVIPGAPDQASTAGIIAVLMLGNAAALALAGWGLGRRSQLAWLFALALLLVNTVLTVADQMGLWDWLFLALELAMLGLLLAVARRYVGVRNEG
ncbi:MAG TPA: hypothetical protein VL334_24480 [Anaerolineae bacterium]|nr:hypothetical protein [Anaerolineae bacterium]